MIRYEGPALATLPENMEMACTLCGARVTVDFIAMAEGVITHVCPPQIGVELV